MNKFNKGIIDASFLAYRTLFTSSDVCFYIDDDAINTTIINGVLLDLIRILKKYPYIQEWVICYDSRPTNRLNHDDSYKKNRALFSERKTAIKFRKQLQILQEMLQFSKLSQIQIDGFESDDLIASVSKNDFCLVIANDKDLYQLLDRIVIDTLKEVKDKEWFVKKYEIEPCLWAYVQAVVGDSVDNIKGIKGVGIVKGLKLIRQYGKGIVDLYPEIIEYLKLTLLDESIDIDNYMIKGQNNLHGFLQYVLSFQLFNVIYDNSNLFCKGK